MRGTGRGLAVHGRVVFVFNITFRTRPVQRADGGGRRASALGPFGNFLVKRIQKPFRNTSTLVAVSGKHSGGAFIIGVGGFEKNPYFFSFRLHDRTGRGRRDYVTFERGTITRCTFLHGPPVRTHRFGNQISRRRRRTRCVLNTHTSSPCARRNIEFSNMQGSHLRHGTARSRVTSKTRASNEIVPAQWRFPFGRVV